MTQTHRYADLDRPEVLSVLFHPRPESPFLGGRGEALTIPVGEGEQIGGVLHSSGAQAPTLLFFHGNGEIVADYQELAPQFTQRGINFLPVDYRGYGRSSGSPTVRAMMHDCHDILAFCRTTLQERGYTGPLLVMGRSLGSASALELAAAYPGLISGLIIESGFAYAAPLLRLMGVDMQALGLSEETVFDQLAKIEAYSGPTLIIHAEQDQIIPFSEGQALYGASGSQEKQFLAIPQANHNDILFRDLPGYMQAVQDLAGKAKE